MGLSRSAISAVAGSDSSRKINSRQWRGGLIIGSPLILVARGLASGAGRPGAFRRWRTLVVHAHVLEQRHGLLFLVVNHARAVDHGLGRLLDDDRAIGGGHP